MNPNMHFLWHWNDFSGVFRCHTFYRFLSIPLATSVDNPLIIQDTRSSCYARYYIHAYPECYPPFQQLLSPSLGSQRKTKDTHVVSCVAFISETSETNVCVYCMIKIWVTDFTLNMVSNFAVFISFIILCHCFCVFYNIMSRVLLFVHCRWKICCLKNVTISRIWFVVLMFWTSISNWQRN